MMRSRDVVVGAALSRYVCEACGGVVGVGERYRRQTFFPDRGNGYAGPVGVAVHLGCPPVATPPEEDGPVY